MKTAPFTLIQGILVDHSLFTQPFACDLSTCHGACCWQGDAGAPLEPPEAETLQRLYPKLAPHLSQAGRNQVAAKGTSYRYRGKHRTTVLDFGLCAYARIQEDGVIRCGIQQAYRAGAVDFEKPISCHLYPLRRRRNWLGMEYLYYEQRGICESACGKGRREGLAVFQFVRDAIVRQYGEGFYEKLEEKYVAFEERAPA
ncbi:MAG: DUF3109 family protein [Lewinellaceae bacterium]|nr:DUF3109 family protein [Lewinellaceae bacterium]